MSGVSGPFAIPSVVSGAEKAVKDLEQLATADPEALIDSIEALLPDGTNQDAGVTTGSSAGLVTGLTGLADPVLSKGNGSLTQGGGCKPAVKCGTLYSSSAFTHLIAPKQCLFFFGSPKAVSFPLVITLKQVPFPFHTSSTRHRQASQLSRGSTLRASRLASGNDSQHLSLVSCTTTHQKAV